MSSSTVTGQHYEKLARDYLLQQGLSLLEQNYHSRFGEIDLIMLDHKILCFIEVKFRKSNAFGGAASAIPRAKQQKIIKTAQCYISASPAVAQKPMRFDALIMQLESSTTDISVDWIQNAFYTE
ncbi:MAG: putative endonuclease [Gammaproteobacteria bacterium]|jgi:putative endonuclease